jgi:hypothetical protein
MNSKINVSSESAALSAASACCPVSSQRATVSSRRRRACSLRSRSVNRRAATVIIQPFGLSGTPSSGHWVVAASIASCTASSAVSKLP